MFFLINCIGMWLGFLIIICMLCFQVILVSLLRVFSLLNWVVLLVLVIEFGCRLLFSEKLMLQVFMILQIFLKCVQRKFFWWCVRYYLVMIELLWEMMLVICLVVSGIQCSSMLVWMVKQLMFCLVCLIRVLWKIFQVRFLVMLLIFFSVWQIGMVLIGIGLLCRIYLWVLWMCLLVDRFIIVLVFQWMFQVSFFIFFLIDEFSVLLLMLLLIFIRKLWLMIIGLSLVWLMFVGMIVWLWVIFLWMNLGVIFFGMLVLKLCFGCCWLSRLVVWVFCSFMFLWMVMYFIFGVMMFFFVQCICEMLVFGLVWCGVCMWVKCRVSRLVLVRWVWLNLEVRLGRILVLLCLLIQCECMLGRFLCRLMWILGLVYGLEVLQMNIGGFFLLLKVVGVLVREIFCIGMWMFGCELVRQILCEFGKGCVDWWLSCLRWVMLFFCVVFIDGFFG